MTLVDLGSLGDVALGYSNPQEKSVSVSGVFQELQGLNLAVVSGQCNGGVSMTVSGIATEDTIVAAWEVPVTTATASNLKNRTKSTQITAANTITCNEGLASDSLFFVVWFNKTP